MALHFSSQKFQRTKSGNLLGFSWNQRNTQYTVFVISIGKNVKSGAANPNVIVEPDDNNCDDKTAGIGNGEEYWLRNDVMILILIFRDADILHSQSSWLNNRIMDAANMQKLIYKALGDERSYQSVLNKQKKVYFSAQ